MTTTAQKPKSKSKCQHGNNICSKCSAFKMVFLLKHGNEALKERMPNGQLVNPVRYNFFTKNRKGETYNMQGMLRRFSADPKMRSVILNCNKILFVDNSDGSVLTEITPGL